MNTSKLKTSKVMNSSRCTELKTSKVMNSSRYAASARTSARRSRGNSFKLESKGHAVYYRTSLTDIDKQNFKGTKHSKKKKNFDRRNNCPNTKKAEARLLKKEKKEERQWIAEERKAYEQPILEFIQGGYDSDSGDVCEEFGEDLVYESEDYHSELEEPLNEL